MTTTDDDAHSMAGVCFACAVIIALGGIAVSLAIVAGQSLTWLKAGVWPRLVVQDALMYFDVAAPSTSWVGLQQIVDYVAHTWIIAYVTQASLSGSTLMAAMLLAWLLALLGSKLEKLETNKK